MTSIIGGPDELIETIEDYCEFDEHRVYLLMAIARTRENPQLTSNSEVVFLEVLKDEDDIDRKLRKLSCVTENYRDDDGDPLTFRLYLSVNARNTLKSYFNFLDKMNGWSKDMVYGDEAVDRKLKRVDQYWKSELQRDKAKDDSRFLIDVDTREIDTGDLKQRLSTYTDVLQLRETPNGYHVITEPFNYTEMDYLQEHDDIEVETDRMLFLEYLSSVDNDQKTEADSTE